MIQTIKTHLKQNIDIKLFDEVDSTNNVCKDIAKKDFNTTLVVSNSQTQGRGRLGRSFISEKGKGIYASLLIKPNINILDVSKVTCVVGVCILETLKEYIKDDLYIKWVNDIYLNDKKICGILTESKIANGIVDYLIIGFGINLYHQIFPKDVNASSIEDQTKIIINKNELLSKIVNRIIEALDNINDDLYVNEFRKHLYYKNELVNLSVQGKEFVGRVIDINDSFELLVETSGSIKNITSGEILKIKKF